MSEQIMNLDERAILFSKLPPEVLAWAQTINFDVNKDPGEGRSPTEDAEFFRNFIIEYNKSWSPGPTARWSVAVAGIFYQQTDRLFTFDMNPPVEGFKGWSAFEEGQKKIMRNSREFVATPRLETFRCERKGDVAWLGINFIAKGVTREGQPYEAEARQTVILEKFGDRWLIAHEHLSMPLQL